MRYMRWCGGCRCLLRPIPGSMPSAFRRGDAVVDVVVVYFIWILLWIRSCNMIIEIRRRATHDWSPSHHRHQHCMIHYGSEFRWCVPGCGNSTVFETASNPQNSDSFQKRKCIYSIYILVLHVFTILTNRTRTKLPALAPNLNYKLDYESLAVAAVLFCDSSETRCLDLQSIVYLSVGNVCTRCSVVMSLRIIERSRQRYTYTFSKSTAATSKSMQW